MEGVVARGVMRPTPARLRNYFVSRIVKVNALWIHRSVFNIPTKAPAKPTDSHTPANTNPIRGECKNHKEFDCAKKAS